MKTLFTAATLAAAFALVGCNNHHAHDHGTAPGATSGSCCGTDGSCCKAAPGAVSSEAGCAASCAVQRVVQRVYRVVKTLGGPF